jgi:hypothetical protein
MKYYLRILAVAYLIGFLFHLEDIFDLRLKFSEMSSVWQAWTIYLCLFDFLAAVFLWFRHPAGVFLFFFIASSQLIAYLGFQSVFGTQTELVVFHFATLVIYFIIHFKWSQNE